VFSGVTTVATAPEASLTISWPPAMDDLTPQAAIVYDVFLATASGKENLNVPTAVSQPGATSITLGGLLASTTYYVIVRAVDAAGNVVVSLESDVEKSGLSGTDDVAPVFGGCTSATAVDAQSIAVTWSPASDNSTPPLAIAYDVYASTTEGGQDFTHPTKTFTASGQQVITGGLVDGLKPGSTYYLVCRARDLSGNEDQNTLARVAATAIDTIPPTFAGVTGVQTITATSVQLVWSTPATDSVTPSSEMVYVAYQAKTSMGEVLGDAGAPVATSAPGATSLTINGLTSNTLYYWIVRAVNRAGLVDSNKAETSAATLVSFSQDVLQILDGATNANPCTNCHVPPTAPYGTVLTPSQAYANIVNVTAAEDPAYTIVIPKNSAQSYLILKLSQASPPFGVQMPYGGPYLPATSVQTIRSWIDQGALNN
jgi:hypothetical protein